MNNSQKPIASVIVLAYNDRRYLEGCLNSLLDQDLPAEDYEIIYADNASTDGSADYVEEHFPLVRVIRLDRNYGFALGNNMAAEAARGRYIAFQNADTEAHKRWLSELIKAMQSDPQIKACFPAGLPLNLGGHNEREIPAEKGFICELTSTGMVGQRLLSLNGSLIPTLFIVGASFLIDSEIIGELKYYFDPTYFIYNEDTDLGLRINNLGYKVVFVPKAFIYHEQNPSRRLNIDRKGLQRAFLVIRNRFITFFKNMYSFEYLLALPLLFIGSFTKVWSLELNFPKKTLYTLVLIPFTIFSFFSAIIRFPNFLEQRRHILQHCCRGRFWLITEMLKRRKLAFLTVD
ncbi:MAG: glycosyltransferase family 2 protein [Chloroflexi bacterium]|nr:MAG: glycosyltransferase family 2 protein [Chloroflexota bacterium]